jgi:hypothetical protein
VETATGYCRRLSLLLRHSTATVRRFEPGRRRAGAETATGEFMKETGYPHGRSGYVIDHIIPLAKGGPDLPTNMQWQTIAAAKVKDAWELK